MDFSQIASTFGLLGIQPPPRLVLLEAQALRLAHVPPTPPDCATLLTGIDSAELDAKVRAVMLSVYPM